MQQVVQSVKGGELRVVDVPRPLIGPTEVLVATTVSLVSSGTERAVRELASSSLVGKARARPDLVRQVVRKARAEGLASTMRAVRSRLDEDMPLGYSAAGVAVEVGEAVRGVQPGDRVATGGAGHAEYQAVAANLAVPLPDGVSDSAGAFATVAAIALHGLRQADVGPGARICVIGLGLVGQLTVRLALAAGYEVAGIDLRDWTVQRAADAGALGLVEAGAGTTATVLDWSRGRGADAVLLTAATSSSAPVQRATSVARDRANVVVVGDVGLELARAPFYEKELTLRFARSYGPGRYDRAYEQWGVDLPVGYVRWSEGRNLEAFCDLVASGRVAVDDLVTHRFPVERAGEAYAVLDGDEPYLGVQLTYDTRSGDLVGTDVAGRNGSTVELPPREASGASAAPVRDGGSPKVALLGAGTFARATLAPALQAAGFDAPGWVVSASGRTARHLAERIGAERATSDIDAVLADPAIEVVLVATPHDTHAALVQLALDAGKHVFCEKPLSLTEEDLDAVEAAWRASGQVLQVGFNRRHSPGVRVARSVFGRSGGPLVVTQRINAGALPESHWYHDRRQGGRLLGEVCHFIDTANAIVQHDPVLVVAGGGGHGEALLADDVSVLLRYPDGSTATIAYGAGGHPSTPKERVEVLGRGHSLVIDDYRSVTVDGKVTKAATQDKGHVEQLAVLRDAIRSGGASGTPATEASLVSMRATFAAARSLLDGRTSTLDEPAL